MFYGAELRRHHADRLGGARGQGQPEGHQGHGRGDAQGRISNRCAGRSSTTSIYPIRLYLLKTEKLKNGEIEMRIQKTVFEKHKDSYYQDCKMKW